VLSKHTEIEGEMQPVYFFFGELSRKELNVLAVRLLWQVHKRSPENDNLTKMVADAVKDMLNEHKLQLNDFSDYPQGTEIVEDTLTAEMPVQQDARSKYDKVKTTQSKIKPTEKFTTLNYMFVDLKQDADFVNFVQQTKNAIEDEEIIDIVQFAGERKGIGTEGLLLFDPAYYFSKNGNVNFEKSLKGKADLAKTLAKSCKSLNFPIKNLQNDQLMNFNTKEYNSYCKLQDWISDIAQIKTNMVYYQNDGIASLAGSLGCKYLVLTSAGMKSGKYMSGGKLTMLITSALCPIAFPAYFGRFLAPRRIASANFVAVEIETGKTVYAKQKTTENGFSQKGIINAFLYDCLYQLKNGGKNHGKKK
jgi:hypothetical protein